MLKKFLFMSAFMLLPFSFNSIEVSCEITQEKAVNESQTIFDYDLLENDKQLIFRVRNLKDFLLPKTFYRVCLANKTAARILFLPANNQKSITINGEEISQIILTVELSKYENDRVSFKYSEQQFRSNDLFTMSSEAIYDIKMNFQAPPEWWEECETESYLFFEKE